MPSIGAQHYQLEMYPIFEEMYPKFSVQNLPYLFYYVYQISKTYLAQFRQHTYAYYPWIKRHHGVAPMPENNGTSETGCISSHDLSCIYT